MNVEIHVPAIRVEQLETETNSHTIIETRDETTVVIRHDVTRNPNFDYYLQPKADLLYNYFGHSGRFSYGGVDFNRTNEDVTLNFNCLSGELHIAAQERASEDSKHVTQVLAEWTYLAESNDYDELATELQEALDAASEEAPEAEYRKEIGGGADVMQNTTDDSHDGKTYFEAQ